MKLFRNPYFFQVLLLTVNLVDYGMPLSAQTGQRFKQIDYAYDQISGKVNEVHYQAGKPDAFYHRYEYDADNRITKVYTSKDSILWDQDARYVYYDHGPLARTVIGDLHVQGMDYAYTLLGWIKGVNSNLLKSKNDIGNDGLGGSPLRVAKDAFGYTLNYHADDYKPLDGSKWSNPAVRFEALTPNSDLMAASFDLFNGNISSMVTSIEEPKIYTAAPNEVPNKLPQGTAYTYDQLNRLLEMKAFQNLDVTTNTWKQGSTYAGSYHNTFQYDANGNILGQLRANGTGQIIDSLTYKYAKDATGRTKQNRLYHVNDQVSATVFNDDIDKQGAFYSLNANDGTNNYMYDSIGNLIQDRQEEIKRIDWTVYGKIKSITRFMGSLRSDLEFRYDAGGNRIAKIEKPRDANGVKPSSEWIATYYIRDAQANVMGIYKHITVSGGPSFKVIERALYGNSRLGSDYTEVELTGLSTAPKLLTRTLGHKHYEGSNHLGNVLTVFADRKIPRDNNSDGVIDYFEPDVLSSSDYSPFGVVLDGREFGDSGRYGFNGKENDDEVKGEGNSLDFGARIYDSRLGRWLSIDPFWKKYPFLSPYNYTIDNPIMLIDPAGEDIVVAFTGGVFGKNKLTNVKDDVKFAQANTGTTGAIVKDAQAFAEKNNIEFDGAVVQSGATTRKATRSAVKFIKANYSEGEKVIIYGYSYGGKQALALINKLEKEGIKVELLETVDPTDGIIGAGRNLTVDFEINDNVKKSINRFQKIREKGITQSLGGQTKASKNGKEPENCLIENTTHADIDESKEVLPSIKAEIRNTICPDCKQDE